MAYFKCESCGAVLDVPYVGWHFVGKKGGTQHFVHRGKAKPDPKNPLRLIAEDGYDPKMLMPMCWECGVFYKYVEE